MPTKKEMMYRLNNQANLNASLLASAPFYLPLKTSLIPIRSPGSGTPTFTRATIRTITDQDGVLRYCLSGEAVFKGARRVQNTIAGSSENFANASWAKRGTCSVSSAVGVDGITKNIRLSGLDTGANDVYQVGANLYPIAATSQLQFKIKRVSVSGVLGVVNANSPSLGNWTIDLAGLPDSWVTINRYSQYVTEIKPFVTFGGNSIGPLFNKVSGGSTLSVDIDQIQLENVTGLVIQTPAEYVSVGVLSAPFHGANVDGVRYFDWYNGNTVTNNVVIEAQGATIPASINTGYLSEGARTNIQPQSNALTTGWTTTGTPAATQDSTGPDGAPYSAWTLTDNDAGVAEGINYGGITLTAAAYTASVFIKKTSGAQASYPVWYYNVGSTLAIITIDTSNGIATPWSAYTGFSIASGLSATCTSFNALFWRVSMTFTGTAAAWNEFFMPAGTTNATQSSGTTNAAAQGSAVVYGFQLELGSTASSYIPTTTAVPRNADIDAYATAGNITSAAGTVYLEFTPQHAPSGTIVLWGTYVDASNYTAILHDATNLIMRKRIGGTNYDATIALAFTAGTTYKVAGSWGAAVNIACAGMVGTPAADATAAQIAATMQLGADGNSLQQPFAAIRNHRNYDHAFSASQLVAITS